MFPHWLLLACVLGFLILVIAIGKITSKWISSSSDFFVTGREVSFFVNACAIGGIGLCASFVAAMPHFAITLGFWPTFLFYAWFWAGAIVVYGLTIGSFIRRCGAYTISEWMGMRLSTKTRVVCASCQVLGTVSLMAANIAGISGILVPITGYSYIINVVGITAAFLIYTILGGMWAVTLVDVAHLVIGMPAYYIVTAEMLNRTHFLANVPGADWRLFSVFGHLPLWSFTFPSLITITITWFVFVFGSQHYWIRLTSARNERGAVRSAVWGGIGSGVLILGPLTIVGLFALLLVPGNWPAAQAWGQLVNHAISPGLAAWMVVSVLGASMSIASSALMGTSSTVLRDFYQRFVRPHATTEELVLPSRISVLIAGAFTCFLAVFYPGGAAWLLAAAGAWSGPPAVILLYSIYWRRLTPGGAFIGMIAGLVCTLAWQFTPWWQTTLHITWVAVGVTAVVSWVVSMATQSQLKTEFSNVELGQEHYTMLKLLRQGRTLLSDIVDGMKVDGEHLFQYLNFLISRGYMKRMGPTGLAQVTYELTPEGNALLDPLTEEEKRMAEEHLTPADLAVLKTISQDSHFNTEQLVASSGIPKAELNSHIMYLVAHDFLDESGLWRRVVRLSNKGRGVLEKSFEIIS